MFEQKNKHQNACDKHAMDAAHLHDCGPWYQPEYQKPQYLQVSPIFFLPVELRIEMEGYDNAQNRRNQGDMEECGRTVKTRKSEKEAVNPYITGCDTENTDFGMG